MILILFAFISGLVTIAAPCIWPILPIVLSSAASGGHKKPLGITLGVVTSFSILTLSISYVISIIPFDPEWLRYVSVIIIGFLGATLIIPQLGGFIEGSVSKLSSKIGPKGNQQTSGFGSGFVTGLSLGIVWTPCAGPILATIATLSATRSVNAEVVVVMIAYMIGVAIPLFIFALSGQKLFAKVRGISAHTGTIQKVFGTIMIITAILIATGYDRKLQASLLNAIPSYSTFLTELESNDAVTKQLDRLRGTDTMPDVPMPFPEAKDQSGLPKIRTAPDFVGITKWLNTDKELSMKDLRGKVVLIDFWTYTCINCIRTLPYVTGWYDKYKDDGFVVIGVHAPEFEFEKKTENVLDAIKEYEIKYPVAQDNDFRTWRAYDNHYWPAKYLIDAQGVVRYTHFGEGEYDVTEENIQKLLKEAGMQEEKELLKVEEQTPRGPQTPETYLGLSRIEYYAGAEQPKYGEQTYSIPDTLPQDRFSYVGKWNLDDEYAESVEVGSGLLLRFMAKDVYLVITPKSKDDRIAVFLDNELVTDQAGDDVKNGFVQIDEARLYHLVHLDKKEDHILQLNFQTVGTRIFAFTFGS